MERIWICGCSSTVEYMKKYDLSNICLKTWDVVRKLEWKEKCDPADNEDLLLFHLF